MVTRVTHPPTHVPPPAAPRSPAPETTTVLIRHLVRAVELLATLGGSPPDVTRELEAVRAMLGKES
jgi:hypothetical protein